MNDIEKALQTQIEEEVAAGQTDESDSFCQTLSCLIDPQVLFGLLEEANRRLIIQNINKRFDFAD